jgi:hypothetical protein
MMTRDSFLSGMAELLKNIDKELLNWEKRVSKKLVKLMLERTLSTRSLKF